MPFLKFNRFILFVMFSFATTVFAQNFTLKNEDILFSFDTQNGKKVTLNKDKANEYIIYRFGSANKIEFEFPDRLKSSFADFKYSFYMRGGGTQNEGMDLNYISFTNKGFKYVIYDTYFSVGNKLQTGIKIINLTSNKTTTLKGNTKTRKGTLSDFRDNKLLGIGEELFD